MDSNPHGRGKQFAREARIGMTIIALLVAAFVYVTIKRFSDVELPQATNLRDEARAYFKNRPIPPESRRPEPREPGPIRQRYSAAAQAFRGASDPQSQESALADSQPRTFKPRSPRNQTPRNQSRSSSFASRRQRSMTHGPEATEFVPDVAIGEEVSPAEILGDFGSATIGSATNGAGKKISVNSGPDQHCEIISSASNKTQKITVQCNDTFWDISQRAYGTGIYYRALHEFNRAQFADINTLKIGQTVSAPPAALLRQRYPHLIKNSGHVSQATFEGQRSQPAAASNSSPERSPDQRAFGAGLPERRSVPDLPKSEQPQPASRSPILKSPRTKTPPVKLPDAAKSSTLPPLLTNPRAETPVEKTKRPASAFQPPPRKLPKPDIHPAEKFDLPPVRRLPAGIEALQAHQQHEPNIESPLSEPIVDEIPPYKPVRKILSDPSESRVQPATAIERPAELSPVVEPIESQLPAKEVAVSATSATDNGELPILADDKAPNFGSRKQRRSQKRLQSQTPSTYVVKKGDNLFSIARDELSQASRYLEILELNKQQLPAKTTHLTELTVGTELQLPRSK